jgi:hypothetical protein
MGKTYRRASWEDRQRLTHDQSRGADLAAARCTTPEQFCLHKQGYPTRNEALAAAKVLRHRKGALATAYKCPRCTLYHITTGQ